MRGDEQTSQVCDFSMLMSRCRSELAEDGQLLLYARVNIIIVSVLLTHEVVPVFEALVLHDTLLQLHLVVLMTHHVQHTTHPISVAEVVGFEVYGVVFSALVKRVAIAGYPVYAADCPFLLRSGN